MSDKQLTIPQRKAIHLLIVCEMREDEVADHLGISTNTLKKWSKDPQFIEAAADKLEKLEKHDIKYRLKHHKVITTAIIEEIEKRIAEGSSLKRMKMETLLKVLQGLNHEVRLDSGDATSRKNVEHHIIDELSNRYSEAIAKRNVEEKPNLRLVEPPMKGTANG